ncbi:hypothetical protein [Nocardia sp. NBC_01327]|uniref:hypothetical protein n=1 Tax=Nocardia sp. NBC_01327 TaxID=2903593 RepID=UPI002E0F0B72|nr:hypothetical protein OG326_23825 [Nocardia sp. NBC_01327]
MTTTSLALEFPAGSMLAVVRAPTYDPFGDGERVLDHEIGPCDIPYMASRPVRGAADSRAHAYVDIRAPATSDVLKSDWLQLPNGLWVKVTSIPNTPRNPFTGWSPFTHFQVERVS